MADLLGADPGGIVFGRSMTALTYDMARTLAAGWGPGDEVVVTRLDHDGNIRPWVQAAASAGATVRWAEFDPDTGELSEDAVAEVLSARTRLVAVTAASNLIGTRPPVRAITDLAHEAGALTYVDGVHFTAHAPVHVDALGADFYACSPYKFLGPHCGVLAARPRCWRRCARPSCCPPPTPYRSVSSWAPCPTSCWPAPPPRSTSWPASAPSAAPAGAAGPRDGRARGLRGRAAGADRGRAGRAARGRPVLPGRAPDADAAARVHRPGAAATRTRSSPSTG